MKERTHCAAFVTTPLAGRGPATSESPLRLCVSVAQFFLRSITRDNSRTATFAFGYFNSGGKSHGIVHAALRWMDERDPLTEKILGCAVALHRAIGPALKESVYHRGLEIEFEAAGILFVSKPRYPVLHRGKVLGDFYPDFIVDEQVIVEVKSASAFDRVFEAQMITYLRVTNLQRALLLNFGRGLMRDGIHRFANNYGR